MGLLSPCGTVSDPSDGLRGSADVHKHAETIPFLSRCFLSLAEGGESQIGMHEDDGRRPRGRTGFSLLSPVQGGWVGGLPGFHSPRKYAHLRTLLPAHWCRRCGNWPKKLKIDHLSPNGLCVLERGCCCVCVWLGGGRGCSWPIPVVLCCCFRCAAAMIGGICLGSSLPGSFFSDRSLAAHVSGSPSLKAHLTVEADNRHSRTQATTGRVCCASSGCAAAHSLDVCAIKRGPAGFCRRDDERRRDTRRSRTAVCPSVLLHQESRAFLDSRFTLFFFFLQV